MLTAAGSTYLPLFRSGLFPRFVFFFPLSFLLLPFFFCCSRREHKPVTASLESGKQHRAKKKRKKKEWPPRARKLWLEYLAEPTNIPTTPLGKPGSCSVETIRAATRARWAKMCGEECEGRVSEVWIALRCGWPCAERGALAGDWPCFSPCISPFPPPSLSFPELRSSDPASSDRASGWRDPDRGLLCTQISEHSHPTHGLTRRSLPISPTPAINFIYRSSNYC